MSTVPNISVVRMIYSDEFVLCCTGLMIGIGPQRNHITTEAINSTVEYCVVIAVPDIIQRSDFSLCVSTVDGTATGTTITEVTIFTHSIGIIWVMIQFTCTLSDSLHWT